MRHGLDVLQPTNTTTVQVPEHSFEVSESCPACPVRIGEWIMTMDFLVLRRLRDFDVILEMDSLFKYYATIDCESRIITFRKSGQKEYVFKTCRGSLFASTVSALQARKLIDKGCVAYLATVVEERKEELNVKGISVARECPNVFPAELPRMLVIAAVATLLFSFFFFSFFLWCKRGRKRERELNVLERERGIGRL